VSTSAAVTLRELLRPPPSAEGIDRKALAGLLVELARNVKPEESPEVEGVPRIDLRLEELRRVVLGREIELLARLSAVVEDPEQLAAAVGRVLPTAVAHATADERLGQVLTPAFEKATQSSIRSNPRTLINILYPLIVPAIRKAIGETIDDTFQSLNESLKASLTWCGLKWRFEAWRTGTTFAETVLKHTLVYQVEHVFLIHHHTGLLIAHAAAENAASQDPQLVSSMLVAIQDFVRDSFTGAEQQGLDTLRLGELRLWSERGPFATLVAVIRGNPPEELHATLSRVLSQIHSERPQALESFDGDSSSFGDIEAHLAECAALRQQAAKAPRRSFPWMVAAVGTLLLLLIGAGGAWWQHDVELRREEAAAAEAARLAHERAVEAARQAVQELWADAVARLGSTPGIVVTQSGMHDGKFRVSGLRDPLAADPSEILGAAGFDPARVESRWVPYEALEPDFMLQRLQVSLDPPPAIRLSLEDGRIVARGAASSTWLEHARAVGRMLPAGGTTLDLSQVVDPNHGAIAKLRGAIQAREIHFDSNEPLPSPGQEAVLDQLAAELKELASLTALLRVNTRVTLTGHSDDTGRGTFNLSLSMARAGVVSALLKKRGVDPNLLIVNGAGPLDPLQAGSTDAARTANRRVQFAVGTE
jgi:outer membrane protein OmpA-like peptidoglycan-associated protein